MGLELARAFITVGADSSGASEAFHAIERSAEGSMANVKRIMTSVMGFVGSYIGASQIKKGLFAAGTIEQDQIAFETLLGSAEEAKKLITDLTTFAAKTPYEMPQIKVAARGLVTFGERGEQLMESLNILGNAAAGTSSDFGMLATIFNQIRGVGKLLTQDFRQLASRGVMSLQDVADYYKVTTAAAQEMMSKGKISFEDVRKMLTGFSKEGGKFYNLMERQSGSFKGMLSTVSDTVNITMAAIGEGIRPAATAIMGATLPLLELIRGFTTSTGPLVGNIAVMTTAITSLTSTILAARVAMQMMGLTFKQVLIGTGWGVALVALGVALGAVVTGLQKLWTWLTSLKPVQDAMARMAERLAIAWEIFKTTMLEVGSAVWSAIKQVADVVINFFGVSLEGLPATATEAFVSILDTISNFVVQAAAYFGAVVENWGETWTVAKEYASVTWQSIVEMTVWAWGQVGIHARAAMAGLQGMFVYLAGHWKTVLAAIVDVALITWSTVAASLGAAFAAIDWGKLSDAFGNLTKMYLAHSWGMISGLAEVFNWIIENWKDILTRMLNAWMSFSSVLPKALYAAIKSLASGGTLGDAFSAAIGEGMSQISSAMGDSLSVGAEAGQRFAQGYESGLNQAKDALGVDQTVWESLGDIGAQAYAAATAAAEAGMKNADEKISRLKTEMEGLAMAYQVAQQQALADEDLTYEESEDLKARRDQLAKMTAELTEKINAAKDRLEKEAKDALGGEEEEEKEEKEEGGEEKEAAKGGAMKETKSGFAEFGQKIQDMLMKSSEQAQANDLLKEGNEIAKEMPEKIAEAMAAGTEGGPITGIGQTMEQWAGPVPGTSQTQEQLAELRRQRDERTMREQEKIKLGAGAGGLLGQQTQEQLAELRRQRDERTMREQEKIKLGAGAGLASMPDIFSNEIPTTLALPTGLSPMLGAYPGPMPIPVPSVSDSAGIVDGRQDEMVQLLVENNKFQQQMLVEAKKPKSGVLALGPG